MNSRKRLKMAINKEIPDRVPVSPYLDSVFVGDYLGKKFTEVDPIYDVYDVQKEFGFDVCLRNISVDDTSSMGYRMDPSDKSNFLESKNWKCSSNILNKDDFGWEEEIIVETPEGLLSEKCKYKIIKGAFFRHKTENMVKENKDLELIIKYMPSWEPNSKGKVEEAMDLVRGGDGIVICDPACSHGVFNWASEFRNLESLLTDPYLKPKLYSKLMSFLNKRLKENAMYSIRENPDMIRVCVNVANGRIVGPDYYDKHIVVYEKEYIRFIQNNGIPVLVHNCGYGKKLYPCYEKFGMAALESFSPPPIADNDIKEAKDFFGTKTTLIGNIDQVHLLREGSFKEIEKAVRETIKKAAPGGSFILGTSDELYDDTPYENLQSLSYLGKKYGRY